MTSLSIFPLASFASERKPVITVRRKQARTTSISCTNNCGAKAFFLNPSDERIVKEALKEPVAFMGGMFAGLLRLDLNDDPLKEWVARTVEASGITQEELDPGSTKAEEIPQQIEIE